MEALRAAVAADPGRAQAHCNLALLLSQRGDVQEAVGEARAALDCDPSDACEATASALLEKLLEYQRQASALA